MIPSTAQNSIGARMVTDLRPRGDNWLGGSPETRAMEEIAAELACLPRTGWIDALDRHPSHALGSISPLFGRSPSDDDGGASPQASILDQTGGSESGWSAVNLTNSLDNSSIIDHLSVPDLPPPKLGKQQAVTRKAIISTSIAESHSSPGGYGPPMTAATAALTVNASYKVPRWSDIRPAFVVKSHNPPERCVFFPPPPENASERVYHTGHHKPWAPRPDKTPSGVVSAALARGELPAPTICFPPHRSLGEGC